MPPAHTYWSGAQRRVSRSRKEGITCFALVHAFWRSSLA